MKFNFKKVFKKQVVNHEGAKAWSMSPDLALYSLVVTSSLSNTFYEQESDRVYRINHLMRMVAPEFVAQLAIYAREQMHLRSVPLVLLVELAKIHRGDSLVKNTVARVVQRADEITELLAYYQLANNRKGTKQLNKLSKQIQKGLGLAFNKFDEYQFAKYNRKAAVTLKDALFLVHPKAESEMQQVLFNKIAQDQLAVPYTWEVELSKTGQLKYDSEALKKAAFRNKWEELIDSNRLGYMALMRNLRNLLQADISLAHIQKVADILSDPLQVKRSKQLPIRFLSAFREISAMNHSMAAYILTALEDAVKYSAENIKGFGLETRILLAADVSGSMYTTISKRSKVRCYDIGLMLSMLMHQRSSNVVCGIFGSKWKAVSLPKNNILSNTMILNKLEGSVGYATNGHLVIKDLIKKEQVMDKVMFFTDLQMYDSEHGGNSLQNAWLEYKQTIAPNAKLYLFDLQGYGQTPLKVVQNEVYLIAGWSDKIFDILAALEEGKSTLDTIRKIEI